MYLAHQIKLYPTASQIQYLEQAMGCRRHCYNHLLAHFAQEGVKWNKKDATLKFKELRAEYEFYHDVSQRVTYNTIDDLDSGFRRFFKNIKQGKAPGFPKFKKKGIGDSFSLRDPHKFTVNGRRLRLERLKTHIKLSQELRFKGTPKQVTISKSPSGKYYASILVDTSDYPKTAGTGSVGIDLGINTLAYLSDGTRFENRRSLQKSLKKLKKYQRILSKKVKGSNRRAKTKLKVARIHARIRNQRRAYLNEITDFITRHYYKIYIEDLNVAGMLKSTIARSIQDVGLSMFRRMLEYKSRIRGNELVVIDRFYPSSKTCSGCGTVDRELPRGAETYKCSCCGLEINRDFNAAINILKYGEDTTKPTYNGHRSSNKSSNSSCVDGVNMLTEKLL